MPHIPCVVAFCTKTGTLSFPKDENRRLEWIKAIEHKKPGINFQKHSRICSDHFRASDFNLTALSILQADNARKRLKKTAVPSVFPWIKSPKNSHEEDNETIHFDNVASSISEEHVLFNNKGLIKTYSRGSTIDSKTPFMMSAIRHCAKCGEISKALDETVTLHRFPRPGKTNILKAKAWAMYCWPDKDWSTFESLKNLHTSGKVICSRHFEDDCYLDSEKKIMGKFCIPGDKNYVKKLVDYLRTQASSTKQAANPKTSKKQPCSPASKPESKPKKGKKVEGDEHHNVLCNECQEQISGYVCVECVDWDMCSECEARAEHSHHYVLRIPAPRPQIIVKTLITAIQEQLKSFFLIAQTVEPYEEFDIDYDVTIKEEPIVIEENPIVPQETQSMETRTPEIQTQSIETRTPEIKTRSIETRTPEIKTQSTETRTQEIQLTQNTNPEKSDTLVPVSSIVKKESEIEMNIKISDTRGPVSSIVKKESEIQTTIKIEPMSSETFVPEPTPSASVSEVTEDDPLTQQYSSITVYSTHIPANKKKRYK